MKRFLLIGALAFSSIIPGFSQEDEKTIFDFWVGKWEVTWDEGNGKIGKGINSITKILGNAVIQENFKIDEGANKGYLGTSISVYNPKNKTWHQGYADNQGAFFSFNGERSGDKRIFKSEAVVQNGKTVIQRMVFYEIKPDAFMWDWESTTDGGSTWKLNWRISYKRL